MYGLRGIISRLGAFGFGLSLACAGADGADGAVDGSARAERGRAAGPESRHLSAERAVRQAGTSPGRGEVVSPGQSEPGTQGSNTNWRPGEPEPGRDSRPLPKPLDPDDVDPPFDPEAPDDGPGTEDDAPEQGTAAGQPPLPGSSRPTESTPSPDNDAPPSSSNPGAEGASSSSGQTSPASGSASSGSESSSSASSASASSSD